MIVGKQRETDLSGHHTITARELQTALHIFSIQNIPIREHGHIHSLLDGSDLVPVCKACKVTLHLPCPPVARQDLCASSLHHLSVRDSFLHVWKHTKLGSDGDRKVCMQFIDLRLVLAPLSPMNSSDLTQASYELPIVLQESTIPSTFRNVLRAATRHISDCSYRYDTHKLISTASHRCWIFLAAASR